jgi:hypothetical protein
MRGRQLIAGLAALVAFGVFASVAAARPRVSVSLPGSTNAATSIPFSYSASGIGRGERVVLQRPEGTGHVWRTVLTLHSGTRSATLPGLAIGRYQLRIATLAHFGHLLAQQPRRVMVFGNVAFASLFGIAHTGVVTVPTGTFPYALHLYDGLVDYTAFSVGTANPCRSVSLQYVPYIDPVASQNQGTGSIVQQSADPVTTTVPTDTVSMLNADLVPGQSWAFNVSQPDGGLIDWYINGTANCDSTTAPWTEDPEDQ